MPTEQGLPPIDRKPLRSQRLREIHFQGDDGILWDMPAYIARAWANCFICELLAGTSCQEHEVACRDDAAVVFCDR